MATLIEVEPERTTPAPQQVKDRFDLQDGLIVAGIAFAEAAAMVIWWPASLILAALFCLGFAIMIELSKSKT